jgi:hypothetical protein
MHTLTRLFAWTRADAADVTAARNPAASRSFLTGRSPIMLGSPPLTIDFAKYDVEGAEYCRDISEHMSA